MFEGFGKKIVAKVHETMETKKAEETLSFQQKMESREREALVKEMREAGVEFGNDIKVENHYKHERGFDHTVEISGTVDGRSVNLQFDFKLISKMPQKWETSNFKYIVDGVQMPTEEAEAAKDKFYYSAIAAAKLFS